MAFVNADILVVTNSSMSTWAALFARGLVILPAGNVKHFKFDPNPDFLIPFVDKLSPLPNEWLVSHGCIPAPDMPATSPKQTAFGQWL